MKWNDLLPLLTFGGMLIVGGWLAYSRFHHGNIGGVGAVLFGIAFPLFGAISLFDGRLLPRLGVFVKATMLLIAWSLFTLHDLIKGNTGNVLILSIILILVGVPMLFEDEPTVKGTIRHRLKHTRSIGIFAALAFLTGLLLWLFFKD